MTKQTEALKLALEAFDDLMKWQMARDAVREALAQPEQEPKCGAIIEVFGKDWRLDYMSLPVGKHKLYTQQYTYTTPPQRTWVGLTNDEVNNFAAGCHLGKSVQGAIYEAEAKLKDKNNG